MIADLKPCGRYVATDVYKAGGVALVARELKKAGLIDPSTLNVDGRTLGEIADAAVETEGQQVVVPIETPIKPRGGIAILRGNLAPDGCVLKLAGHERHHHRGPARVFDSEEETFAAVKAGKIVAGDVVVIRYEGPVGGPGCARCCTSRRRSSAKGFPTRSRSSPTAASRARRTASWSGTSRPRPRRAGRSPPLREGDMIVIDVDAPRAARRALRRRDPGPPRRLDTAAALHDRRAREVRGAGLVRLGGGGDTSGLTGYDDGRTRARPLRIKRG